VLGPGCLQCCGAQRAGYSQARQCRASQSQVCQGLGCTCTALSYVHAPLAYMNRDQRIRCWYDRRCWGRCSHADRTRSSCKSVVSSRRPTTSGYVCMVPCVRISVHADSQSFTVALSLPLDPVSGCSERAWCERHPQADGAVLRFPQSERVDGAWFIPRVGRLIRHSDAEEELRLFR